MDYFCRLSLVNFSFSMFGMLLKLGYQPNTIIFNTLIHGHCIKGEVENALNLEKKMVSLGFRTDQITYGILIDGLCKTGETRAVMHLLR